MSSPSPSTAPSYQGPLRPGAASESVQPATIIIVLVACLFNAVSILLVSRYLFLRFSHERQAYAAEAAAEANRRQQQRDIETGTQSSMQAQLARFTPILVLQPDSKVACAHKDPALADATGAGCSAAHEGTASASAPQPQPLMMYVGQLPQGTMLFPGSTLHASPSSGRLSRSLTNLAAGPSGSGESASGGIVGMGVGAGEPDQATVQSSQQQRRPSLLSVAYLGSGVYLWGARRDPLYRDRVHGRAAPVHHTP
ncbi:hypothetical protein COCOBI_11-4670 [Coccomyxa sp. Obi]|nr:hypothetical protein COCOBI_11-4670 [Coccomyxa sp. Obi]